MREKIPDMQGIKQGALSSSVTGMAKGIVITP